MSKIEQSIDGQKITLEIVDIDPGFAKELLDTMVDNRPLKQKTLDGMVRAMKAGKFPFCADPIRINELGELDDGEHRLRAIVASNTTQPMLIGWGFDPKTRMNYDIGTPRRAGDQVRLGLKVKNGAAMASIANLLLRWERGLVSSNFKPTQSEQYDYVEQNLELMQRAFRHQANVREGLGSSGSATGAAFIRFQKVNPVEAELFMKMLATGIGLAPGRPLYTLRQALITRQQRERWTQTQQVFAYVRCWNGERNQENMTKLQFPSGSWTPAHFRIL